MKIKVPYKKYKNMYMPMVGVNILGCGLVNALIDSGAKSSIFQKEIADALGIEICRGRPAAIEGVGGRIVTYEHKVTVDIAGVCFDLKMAFSDSYKPALNILGRNNFFHNFIVTFDDLNRLTVLEPR